MENIRVHDHVFTAAESTSLHRMILDELRFKYGESDDAQFEPTGLVHNFEETSELFQTFFAKLKKTMPGVQHTKLDRAYINLFLPHERPYFHQDGECTTCIFYINPCTSPQEGGETQFLIDEKIYGVLPQPGRLVVFPGTLTHRATSFRTAPRLTGVFKFLM